MRLSAASTSIGLRSATGLAAIGANCSSNQLGLRRGRIRPAFGNHLVDIFLRDIPEAVSRLERGDQLLPLAFGQWVATDLQHPARIVAAPPRFGEANVGIAAEGQALLLVGIMIFVVQSFDPLGWTSRYKPRSSVHW